MYERFKGAKHNNIIIWRVDTGICIGNSMICSDIWHKYHEWYFKIVKYEIWDNFEISLVVFMPNIKYKLNHAIICLYYYPQ